MHAKGAIGANPGVRLAERLSRVSFASGTLGPRVCVLVRPCPTFVDASDRRPGPLPSR